jgi:MFS family permease
VGRREAETFRFLSHFFPDTSVIHSRRMQHLLFSKALSDAARDAAKYAALVAVVSSNGSVFESSLMTVAMLLPTALFGLYAGEVADSLPKRTVIAGAYALAAASCFLIPTIFGTQMGPLVALVFLVTVFGNLASPAEDSVVPLVASEKQVASATSMLGLASSLGTGFGMALLAPLLLKLTSVRLVLYVAGLLLMVAATRVLHTYTKRDVGTGVLRLSRKTYANTFTWLFAHPSVATMVGVSVLAGVANVFMAALAPVYVRDVLGSDPADTVYVMGPAGIAATASLLIAPVLIQWRGERVTAVFGFALVVTALVALGLVERNIATVIDPLNPLRLGERIGLSLSPSVRTAAWLCVPLGLGSGLTTNAVKIYINRRVPLAFQGRTFAAQNVLQSGIAIIPLLAASGIASVVGVSTVLVLTPLAIYGLILLLIALSRRFGGEPVTPRGLVFSTFWEETTDDAFEGVPG